MYCSNCGKTVAVGDKFCSACGHGLSGHVSSSGNGSVNIAGQNTFTNSHVHVGGVYGGGANGDVAYIERTYIKPLRLGRSPVKVSWMVFSGAVGFVGSWASIYSVLGTPWHFIFLLILGLSLFALFGGVVLLRTRFARLVWFNLEANKEGEVFLTKIGGQCPKCDGTLRLVDLKVGPNESRTFVRCSRISDHIWRFDPSVLG